MTLKHEVTIIERYCLSLKKVINPSVRMNKNFQKKMNFFENKKFNYWKYLSTMSEDQETSNTIFEDDSIINTVVKQISYYCDKDKNQMISVFDIKNNIFLYCNDSFKNILGYNTNDIIRGGWEFWYKKIDPGEACIILNSE